MPDICTIFIAYSSKDIDYLNALRNHLKSLEHSGEVRVWYDGEIDAGSDWAESTRKALEAANIILLLISADAIASEYFYSEQLQASLGRYQAGEAYLVPIIVRPCHWQALPVGQLQILPRNGNSVSSWPNQDEAWAEVTFYLEKVVQKVLGKPMASNATKTLRVEAPLSSKLPFTARNNRLIVWVISLIIVLAGVIGGLIWHQKQQKELNSWYEQQTNPTSQGLTQYLNAYPNGRFSNDAKILLEKLREQSDWEQAQTIGDLPAYEVYLSRYSKGQHQREAIEAIKKRRIELDEHIENTKLYLKNNMREAAEQELRDAEAINPLDKRISDLKDKIK